ncbi:hypothetical protein BuS5_03399 [Desulfosarcina sp. BuS5]|uniref:LysM peptidoglycan-binding domain-containing protein n=1 Tax=Desulfosarcina sp. BuS5 TaxID=933262 RepID=UPI00047FB5B5|nr:LysM domain-containing protein [Desulfosarcina sp. BuS5]WDN90428.1 hypothetical protein BuS5_03399 [Desulfosarcina sp. BuS5]
MNCKLKFQTFVSAMIMCALLFNFSLNLCAEERVGEIEYENGFYYTIQKGDTLWDLSQKFSDSPWQWPDLWRENKQLPNPHWIYPGERIRLYLKEDTGSIPENKIIKQKIHQIESTKKQVYYYYSKIDQAGFIKSDAAKPSGTILKVKDKKAMINEGDIIYIREEGGIPLPEGKKYYIYRTMKPVRAQNLTPYPGVQHYFTGIAEIVNKEAGFAVGKVIKSYRATNLYDLLMPYEPIKSEIAITESIKGLKGRIILSEEHKAMIGENDIAFIDKGTKDGIQPGQRYSIFYQEKEKISANSNQAVLLPPVQYGMLLVLRTEKDTSTILITYSEKSAHDGAGICYPLDEG